MKKFSKYILGIISILAFIIMLFLHISPVSFDAYICSGGYSRWIADKSSKELVDIFLRNQGLKEDANVNLISKPEELANTVEWEGRDIYASLKIDIDGKIYNVDYSGKRYWIEKYDWNITNIT